MLQLLDIVLHLGIGQTPLLSFYCSFSIPLIISLRTGDRAEKAGREEISGTFYHPENAAFFEY